MPHSANVVPQFLAQSADVPLPADMLAYRPLLELGKIFFTARAIELLMRSPAAAAVMLESHRRGLWKDMPVLEQRSATAAATAGKQVIGRYRFPSGVEKPWLHLVTAPVLGVTMVAMASEAAALPFAETPAGAD